MEALLPLWEVTALSQVTSQCPVILAALRVAWGAEETHWMVMLTAQCGGGCPKACAEIVLAAKQAPTVEAKVAAQHAARNPAQLTE